MKYEQSSVVECLRIFKYIHTFLNIFICLYTNYLYIRRHSTTDDPSYFVYVFKGYGGLLVGG
jgi:hypothetical protein